MGIEISIQEDYILVKPSEGISYWEILEGIGRVMGTLGCREKNVIWEFCDGPVKLAHDDLYRIRDIMNKYSATKYAKRNKTAIVAATGFQLGMAHYFVKISKDLPCDFGVFSDIRSTRNWITS